MLASRSMSLASHSAPPRLYDFAEGFGSVYGRYVRKHLCQRLIDQYKLRSVLEAPCNAESYFASPGTQSVVFARSACAVTLLHPEEEIVAKTRAFWTALGLGSTPVLHHTDLYHLPFEDGTFDLVWNFDYLPLLNEPNRFVGEMARVSRKLVLAIVPNRRNLGYPVHALFNAWHRRSSPWGSPEWMAARPVRQAMEAQGLRVIESGFVDAPPWPGFDVLNLLGRYVRRSTVEARADDRTDDEVEALLERFTFAERASLPNALKAVLAHQLYVVGLRASA
jgi:hypothetical protein